MKKGLLCILLLLAGCTNGYTLSRNSESDEMKIYLLADEEAKELVNTLRIEHVQISFCRMDCKEEIEKAEDEYADGLIAVGEIALQAVHDYANPNHIPLIEVQKGEKSEALKKLYPEYTLWLKVESADEVVEEADAYYYEEGIEVITDKPFYQENNPDSLCTLVLDKKQFETDLEEKVNLLLENRLKETVLYIDWIKA